MLQKFVEYHYLVYEIYLMLVDYHLKVIYDHNFLEKKMIKIEEQRNKMCLLVR
jgi:hypothetical protein